MSGLVVVLIDWSVRFLAHLVFSPVVSPRLLHWLTSPLMRLSSHGWSFVDHGDQVRSEELGRVQHLNNKRLF